MIKDKNDDIILKAFQIADLKRQLEKAEKVIDDLRKEKIKNE